MYQHQRIEQQLLERLSSPDWRTGDVFLSEGAVAEEFAVSRATAQKALHTLRRKGYLTSRQGKGYIVMSPATTPPTHTLGVVLFVSAHFNHPVTVARMAGLQETLLGTPYAIKTFMQYDAPRPHGRPVVNMEEEFTSAKLDGLNTGIGDLSIEKMRALSREMAVVCNNWFEPGLRWSYVQFDCLSYYTLALRHLFALGHKHIAFLHAIDDMGYWCAARPDYPRMSRLAAQAAREGGMYLECVQVADFSEACGAEVAGHILSRDNRPTAIICADDLLVGVYGEARRRGLEVPRDLSLVGVNDLVPDGALPLPTTEVRLDYTELGRAIGREFLRLLADPAATGREILLPGTLAPRASTAAAQPLKGESRRLLACAEA